MTGGTHSWVVGGLAAFTAFLFLLVPGGASAASHAGSEKPCDVANDVVEEAFYVRYLEPKGFITRGFFTYNPKTGQDAVWHRDSLNWRDPKTGKPLSASATNVNAVEDALYVQSLEPKGFSDRSDSDHTHARNPKTGRTAVWDRKTLTWVDARTGEPLSPSGCEKAEELSISAIHASFVEAQRATTYSVTVKAAKQAKLTYRWRLKLEAIDPAAGVDRGCDNHGVLGTSTTTFVWHHGNSGDPVHDDGCDHAKQGRYGHQGLIKVVVGDGSTSCTATFKGTDTSPPDAVGQGIASKPACTKR